MVEYALVVFFNHEAFVTIDLKSPYHPINFYLDNYAHNYAFERDRLTGTIIQRYPLGDVNITEMEGTKDE